MQLSTVDAPTYAVGDGKVSEEGGITSDVSEGKSTANYRSGVADGRMRLCFYELDGPKRLVTRKRCWKK